MAFLTCHLLNHALGIVSVAAMEQGLAVFRVVWQTPPGLILLYGALGTHLALVIAKLARRRTLRMPAWEAVQSVLGVMIPFWLIEHVAGTRGAYQVFDVPVDYPRVLGVLWPDAWVSQSLLVLIAWLHGCIGLHFWLRLRPWYRRLTPLALVLACALPMLALIGFANGGREIANRDHATSPPEQDGGATTVPPAVTGAWVENMSDRVTVAFVVALGLVATVHGGRLLWHRRGRHLAVTYPDGAVVTLTPGMSVLEGSRSARIPHASVCGGRGRCSTCRVRVVAGLDRQPAPSADEARVLARIRAGPEIRLACQLRPAASLSVVPLLPTGASPLDARRPVDPALGVEREITVLFADLRDFTAMAEGRLPYDVVFVLNQYFRAMAEAIAASGGHVDKFIGDGIMALFGIDRPPDAGARAALRAARAMAEALEELNRRLADEIARPLRMGIGLHIGPAIVGQMGHGPATSLTAIGDTVNVASRLEALSKAFHVQLIVSAEVTARAGIEALACEARDVAIRGRQGPLRVHLIEDARTLPALTPQTAAAGTWWARLRGFRSGRAW